MLPISAIVLTKNEEENLPGCLDSLVSSHTVALLILSNLLRSSVFPVHLVSCAYVH